jgi:hypothetical protein
MRIDIEGVERAIRNNPDLVEGFTWASFDASL